MEEQTLTQGQSGSIGKLAGALAKAQAKITVAKKSSENPFFKSSYADLSSVWDACRSALTENELAVIQTIQEDAKGTAVVTTLAHSSGEWIRGTLYITPKQKDSQAVGSAITYARRYSLSAIVGVAPDDDDDGEGAMGRSGKPVNGHEKRSDPDASPEKSVPEGPGEVVGTFSVPKKFEGKKGDYFKTMGPNATPYYVFDTNVVDYLTKNVGKEIRVVIEGGKWPQIKGYLEVGTAAPVTPDAVKAYDAEIEAWIKAGVGMDDLNAYAQTLPFTTKGGELDLLGVAQYLKAVRSKAKSMDDLKKALLAHAGAKK